MARGRREQARFLSSNQRYVDCQLTEHKRMLINFQYRRRPVPFRRSPHRWMPSPSPLKIPPADVNFIPAVLRGSRKNPVTAWSAILPIRSPLATPLGHYGATG